MPNGKKSPLALDYGVMPLEGLWWADDMSSFTTGNRSDWKWTMMIMQPDFIGGDLIERVRDSLVAKKERSVTIIETRDEL